MMGATVGLVIGAALGGQRFSVWSIVPAGLLVAGCATLGYSFNHLPVLPQFLTVSCALQFGFVLGAASRHYGCGAQTTADLI